jgi:hypothetical protein
MALQQAVGITAGISTTLPATHDAAGFGALTFTAIGKLNAVPDMTGEHDIANFDNLSTGEEEKFADVFRAGDGMLSVGLDYDDTGQTAIEGAVGTKVAWEFTLKDGTVYYRNGIVRSFKPMGFSTGNVVMADVSVAFEKTSVKVDAT